jgi:hypothetical protein
MRHTVLGNPNRKQNSFNLFQMATKFVFSERYVTPIRSCSLATTAARGEVPSATQYMQAS